MKFPLSRRWQSPVLLAFLSGSSLFAGINSYALIGPDEPRYAAVARGMVERGDWVTPMLGGYPWFEKPVLLYWLIGSSYKVFGVSEWSSRLSSGVAALITVLLVYAIGKRAKSESTGLLAGGILLSSLLFFTFARGATFDVLLTACVTGAFASFLVAETSTGPRARNRFILCAVCVALAVLAKGLVGIVLVSGVIASYALATGRLRALFHYPVLPGIAVFLLVCSVWYGPVIAVYGKVFLREFFIEHHLERFTTNRYHHPGPVYYYLAIAAAGVFPWTPLLVLPLARLRDLFQTTWRDGGVSARVLFASWALFPLVFFTLSVSKLPGYYLSALPALALLIAYGTVDAFESGRLRLLSACAWPTLALIVALAIWFAIETPVGLSTAGHGLITGCLLIAAVGSGVLLLRDCWRAAALWLICGLSITIGVAAYAIAPWMSQTLSYRELAEVVRQKALPGEPIVYFGDAPRTVHTLSFYVDRGLFYDEQRGGGGRKELRELLVANRSTALVLVSQSNLELLSNSRRLRVEEIGRQSEMVLLRVRLAEDAGLR